MSEIAPTKRRARAALTAVLLASTALGGFAAGHGVFAETSPTQTSPTQTAPTVEPKPGAIQPQAPSARMPDFAELVKQVKPAVVSVTNDLKDTADEGDGSQGSSPFPFGMMPPGMQAPHQNRHMEARGSGFIIDPNGTIVTNNHVVKDAKTLSVTLDDGTTLPATVIGRDPRTDLAVLRVKADHKLPFINLGDSSTIEPGQWVLAVGNPFGLGGTVTAGIVSARGRDIGNGPYDSFIQVDAPINQGNSGGPLFTQDGKVVGVNTAIISPTGGSVGIGFAIPSNLVKSVVGQLEADGHVTRGYLGVEAQEVTDAMAGALHLPKIADHNEQGALVASVQPDSPAAKAELQPGDVIRSVNGQTIGTPRDLAVDIAAVHPGESAKLELYRDGSAKTIDVAVANLPGEQTADAGAGTAEMHKGVGLALAPISPETRDQLDLPKGVKGALVAQVETGSPAEQAGIQAGDVVLGVGDKAVDGPRQAADAIRGAAHDGAPLALRIMRNGQTQFVAVTPGADNG